MAFSNDVPLKNHAKETQAKRLMHEIACVVCDGEPIAESGVPLAASMRAKVRDLVQEGLSDEAILAWFEAHYGETVRMRPAISARTLPLWAIPVLSLSIGAGLFWLTRRSTS